MGKYPPLVIYMLLFLVAVLAILKLTGMYELSWFMVTSPVWGAAVILAANYYLKFLYGLVRHFVIKDD